MWRAVDADFAIVRNSKIQSAILTSIRLTEEGLEEDPDMLVPGAEVLSSFSAPFASLAMLQNSPPICRG